MNRIMRLAAAIALAVGPLTAPGSEAQPKTNALVDRLPSPEQVESDFGPDPRSSGAACEVISGAITTLGHGSDWESADTAEGKAYQALEACIGRAVYALDDTAKAAYPNPRPQDFARMPSGFPSTWEKLHEIAERPDFQVKVAKRYLAGADYTRWEDFKKLTWDFSPDTAAKRRSANLYLLLVLLGPFAVFSFFVWRAFRPWRYEPTTGTLRFGSRTYTVHHDAGVVVNAAVSQSTHHVAGTRTVETDQFGFQHVRTTSGHSVTTERETIHLIEKSGRERVLRLHDWGISARAGHQVGGIFLVPKGRSSGEYLQIWNFTLDEAKQHRGAALRAFGLRLFGWSIAVLAVSFLFAFGAAIRFVTDDLSSPQEAAQQAVIGGVAGLFAGAVFATLAQLYIVARRRKRFDIDIAAPTGRIAAADAREAAARTASPISPAA